MAKSCPLAAPLHRREQWLCFWYGRLQKGAPQRTHFFSIFRWVPGIGVVTSIPESTITMLIDLFRPYMAPEARDAVAEVLTPDDQGRVYCGQGPKVDAFERALKRELDGEREILTLNSCTSALDLALHLCHLEAGYAVISTPMTCSATNSPVITKGGEVAWADVDPLTGLIDPESVGRILEREDPGIIKAVIAVDWAGRMPDYNRLREVCRPFGVPIIEDAAHAPLATFNGRYQTRVGGDYIAWSFQAIKHLTTGDGGALQCPDRETTERARLLRWYGLDRRSKADFRCEQDITEVGFKSHMNDLNAAIGLANLPHLGDIVHKHRGHARFYDKVLGDLPPERVTLPPPDPGSSYWLYTLLVDDRDSFQTYLLDKGIATSQVHRRNDHHTAFQAAEHPASDARPGLDAFAAKQVSIPVGWWLTAEDLGDIAEAVREWALR
jgi:dTDP-4-amino-4,6-dideoxygalactose transaminase